MTSKSASQETVHGNNIYVGLGDLAVSDSTSKNDQFLRIYQVAINRIDDYFEYRFESQADKEHVREVLEDLTDSLTVVERSDKYD